MFLDLAKQWREMAEQAEELEKRYGSNPSPLAPTPASHQDGGT
jgi:hypothetical protein